jgi:hypothetical protein
MTLTSNNDILLSDGSDIKLLTKSGEIKPFFSVSSSLRPRGIHATSDNYIIVGDMSTLNPPPSLQPPPSQYHLMSCQQQLCLCYYPTDKSTRALLIFGMDGKQQHTYQYDSNKHRLFTIPRRTYVIGFRTLITCSSYF